jgi:biopolymer transport protein ExbD
MVTAPLLTVGVQVDLPESSADSLPEEAEPLTLSINSKGEIFIQEAKVEFDSIIAKVLAVSKNRTDTRIYVRGDKTINYGRVLEIMGLLSGSGFHQSCINIRTIETKVIKVNRSLIISSALHGALIFITAMSLPFLAKKPLDIPPIVSVELIQIAEKTNIPFAPKAKKIIEKVKEEEKKLVSEQAPPKKVKKTKTKTVVSVDKNEKIDSKTPEAIPLPEKTVKKIETKKESKQNPDKLDEEVKQVSEFEKKELVDLDNIAKLIDKAKEDTAKVIKKNNDITQDQDNKIVTSGLTLSEEDALKAQIFGCWSIPLGLPYNEDLLVRIKLMLEP